MKTIDGVCCSTRVHGIVPNVPQLEFDLMNTLRNAHLKDFDEADNCVRAYLAAKFPQLYHNWWAAEHGIKIEDVEDIDQYVESSAIVIVLDADPLITVRVH